MPFFKAKKLDFTTGHRWVAVLRRSDAERNGIRVGDRLEIKWNHKRAIAVADFTRTKVDKGEIGLFRDFWTRHKIKNDTPVRVSLVKKSPAIEAIKKKLLGNELTYKEMYTIVSEIVNYTLGDIEITYFVASGFARNFTDKELYYLTKAVAETGNMLKLKGKKVVDKHSVGGLPGNRVTPIIVPILANFDVYIPKTSSRAITSPAGTADTLETFMPVDLEFNAIKKVVKKTKACMVWGGSTYIAPADDKIIKVSYPLALEPYTKMIVSILAKKVAMGIKYLIVDLPVGKTTKVPDMKKARYIERHMVHIGKKFGMKIKVMPTKAFKPVGRGVGPSLEARDVLRVLQQKYDRPIDLEEKSLKQAGALLEFADIVPKGRGYREAKKCLIHGAAWEKMQEIIKAQGGDPDIDSEDIDCGKIHYKVKAEKKRRYRLDRQ